MKRVYFSVLGILILSLVMASCGQKPEEQVRDFAVKFGDFVNTNNKDSVQKYYPGFQLSDSLATVALSNVIVEANTVDGQYTIHYSPEISVMVKIEKDGSIIVGDSKGILCFPIDKVDITRKTGMWEDRLSDLELSQRIKDENFFNFIEDLIKTKKSAIISIGKLKEPKELYGVMNTTQPLTNTTDISIDANDYSVVVEYEWIGPAMEGYPNGVISRGKTIEPGKNISPKGTVNYPMEIGFRGYSKIIEIKWMLSPEQLQEKFVSYTGNEYQKYLDSNK